MLLAFAARLLVGIGVYLSAYALHDNDPLATVNAWLLASDANQYHVIASRISDFFQGKTATLSLGLPEKYLGYPLALSLIYYVLGAHFFWGVLLNCLAFLGVGFLAHGLALRLGQTPERARWLALLVMLWPPSLAYSSALLKDSLNLLAVFGLLAALTSLSERNGQGRGVRSLLLAGLGAACASCLLVVIRPELGGMALAVAILAATWSTIFGRPASSLSRWRPLLGCLLVAAGIMLGEAFSPARLLPPQTGQGPQTSLQAAPAPPPAVHAGGGAPAPAPAQDLPADAPGWAGQAGRKAAQALEGVWQRRWEYAQTGGVSLVPEAHLLPDGPQAVALIVLDGLRNLLLYPLPWQRWPSNGNLATRAAVAGNTLAWYLLLPGLAWGLADALRRRDAAAGPVAFWVIAAGLALAVIVVNLGTLYRLRDIALLPLLLVFSPAPYQGLARMLRPRRAG